MSLGENRSSVRFRVDVNPGIKDFARMLDLTTADMTDFRDKIDARFRGFMRKQFSTEGSSGGEKWAPLSPAYEKWKKKKYPGRKIMALTGKTRRSLTNKTNPDHVAVWRLKPRPVVEVGTAHKTPAYHSPLSVFRRPNMPPRDVIQTTDRQNFELVSFGIRKFQEKASRWVRAMAQWKRGAGSA